MFNLREIRAGHRKFRDALYTEITRETHANKLSVMAQHFVRQEGKPRVRTGALVKGTRAKVIRTSKGHVIALQNDVPYAAAQDQGSGLYGPKGAKYLIRAKRARALKFTSGGQVLFRKSVMHPGVKPTHFLRNAAEKLGEALLPRLEAAMERAARSF